jgi:transposase
MNFIMCLPGLKDVAVKKIEEVGEFICIHMEMERKVHRCPKCNKKTMRVHDYRIQKISHLKWFERKTQLFYKRRRYVCDCGKRFSEETSFIQRYQRSSIEWNQAISVKSIKGKTFEETAMIYGTSPTTVIRRFDRIAKSEIRQVNQLPKVIAIDEYKGDTREGKYQLIIADGVTREPLEILPNRNKNTIKRYLQRLGTQVEIVIMDMSPAFKAAVQEALDKPLIVADRFHFCRYVYWALDKVRRRVQQTFHAYDRKKCKKNETCFSQSKR